MKKYFFIMQLFRFFVQFLSKLNTFKFNIKKL